MQIRFTYTLSDALAARLSGDIPALYTQADLLLAVLQIKGPTTTDVFEYLGIKSPSAVVSRLKKSGFKISTKRRWVRKITDSRFMLQAEYTLYLC